VYQAPWVVQEDVEEQLTRTFTGQADYRLGLFRGDGAEVARNGPSVGWGTISYKTSVEGKVHRVPFRISHQGFYVRFQGDNHSTVVCLQFCCRENCRLFVPATLWRPCVRAQLPTVGFCIVSSAGRKLAVLPVRLSSVLL
jgi:hypothetical protein